MGESLANLAVFEGTLEEFYQRIAGHNGLVVVEFASTTCQPCKRIRQVLPGFAKANTSVLFLVIELDLHREFATQFGISSVPVIKYFKGVQDGKPVELASIAGADVPAIKDKIAALAQA
jgi:thioredoxin 1